MKRTLWTLLLALGMMMALCVGAGATNQSDFSEALSTGKPVQLENDFTYPDLLYVDSTLTIDLNGYVLEIPGGIYVKSGAHLTITDSDSNKSHKFSTPNPNGCWVWDETNGTKTVPGGVITGGTGKQDSGHSTPGGGGVYVAPDGILTMTGGSIAGCSADTGGGVYVEGAFTMSGSAGIIGCAAGKNGGGGVFVSGTFTMSGYAAITNCSTDISLDGGTGGGVLVEDTGTLTMNDHSTIRDCTAKKGGGVTVNSGDSAIGQFSMMDGSQITGCKATDDGSGGGGIFNSGKVTMTGGRITNCTDNSHSADPESGGVLNHGQFTMSGGTIEAGCTIFNVISTSGIAFTISGGASISADITNCSTLHADGGSVSGKVKNGHPSNNPGTITGSGTETTTFLNDVENNINGTIEKGDFEGSVTNKGTISGGEFNGTVTNNGTIKAAEDGSGPRFSSEVTNNGTISGGEFTGSGFVTNYGTISGGTFSETKEVSNQTGGTITGGTFNGPVLNSGGTISGGDFANLKGAYKVEFVSGGSAAAAAQYVSPGGTVAKPADPAKSGYTFGGWYKDSSLRTPWNFAKDTVTENTTLYAKWTAIPSAPPVSGGGSDSDSDPEPSWSVSAPGRTEHGSVSVSPSRAQRGEAVTVTVKPDGGYALETLTVTDGKGTELALTDKGGGKFTFVMPAGAVRVTASFMEDNSVLNLFYDVPNDAYYYEAVKWAVENGITSGRTDGRFDPGGSCTRAQIVTFLWRAAGCPEPKSGAGFADVSGSAYYAKAVAWAVENGVTSGTKSGGFDPSGSCTRAQAVTFLARALNAGGGGAASFHDVPADSYYAAAVAWAVENGVTSGTKDGGFSPNAACTRAQIVTFLFRAYQGK